MKKCCRCKITKDETEFNKSSSRKDGLQSICRECSNKDRRIYFQEHKKQEYIVRNKKRRKNHESVKELKMKSSCSKCGEKRWYCLDFHHIELGKDKEVSILVAEGWSLKKIKEEISKCIVLCANCHREIHYGDSSSGQDIGFSSQ